MGVARSNICGVVSTRLLWTCLSELKAQSGKLLLMQMIA